jgi:flagellar biosynthesis chaperone FliJ
MENTKKSLSIDEILASILDIVRHIRDAQVDINGLFRQSSDILLEHIKQNKDGVTQELLNGMQLQDIINQQLGAVTEAISAIEKSIAVHLKTAQEDNAILHNSFQKLHKKMIASLEEAKNKQKAFAGLLQHKDEKRGSDELEFF